MGISLLAALFIIFTTLSMGVDERIRQFAMLRAVAFTKWQIGAMVALESLLLGLIGWGGGLLAGWGLLTLMARLRPESVSEGASLGHVVRRALGRLRAGRLAGGLDPARLAGHERQPAGSDGPPAGGLLGAAPLAADGRRAAPDRRQSAGRLLHPDAGHGAVRGLGRDRLHVDGDRLHPAGPAGGRADRTTPRPAAGPAPGAERPPAGDAALVEHGADRGHDRRADDRPGPVRGHADLGLLDAGPVHARRLDARPDRLDHAGRRPRLRGRRGPARPGARRRAGSSRWPSSR